MKSVMALGMLLLMLLPNTASGKDAVYTWSGVYCHTSESADNIAERFVSDIFSDMRSVRRARIALAILGGYEKVVVLANLYSDNPFIRMPVCACARKRVHVDWFRSKNKTNERGHTIRVREYFRDTNLGDATLYRTYWYVGDSQVLCIPERTEEMHAKK